MGKRTRMTVHDFDDSLAASAVDRDKEWWAQVYRQAFPDLVSMVSVDQDGWAQRGGIDRVLLLRSGKTLAIEEKVRSHDWNDFCLEYWSDKERRVRGWIAKELACD